MPRLLPKPLRQYVAWLTALLLWAGALAPREARAEVGVEQTAIQADDLRHAVGLGFGEYLVPDAISAQVTATAPAGWGSVECLPMPLYWSRPCPLAFYLVQAARPGAVMGWFREQLLQVSLSPHAP